MYPVPVAEVARTLGGPAVLGEQTDNLAGLSAAVSRGYPRRIVRELGDHAAPGAGALRAAVEALVASPATLKRSARLSPEASARAERLGRVMALAEVSFGSAIDARQWLTESHLMLGAMPIMVAATDLGARQVERLLHNIAFDLPA